VLFSWRCRHRLLHGAAGRRPAVVLVHGSGGVSPREDRWADELRRAGAATFVLDSFTGRGITFTEEDQAQLSSLAMIGDAYRALELLATHPRIDPERIAVRGFPKGAVAALYSAVTRFPAPVRAVRRPVRAAHRVLPPVPHHLHRRRGGD
jgi:dienelactone hydrolase